jgi:hypothetical protein
MLEYFELYLTKYAGNISGKNFSKNTARSYKSLIGKISNNSDEKFLQKNSEEIEALLGTGKDDNLINLYANFVRHYEDNKDLYPKSERQSKNERFLQELICNNIKSLFPNFNIFRAYYKLKNGQEIDLLLEHKTKPVFKILEIKSSSIEKNNACQIIEYRNELKKDLKFKDKKLEMCIIGTEIQEDVKDFIKNEYVRGNDIELSSIQVKLIDVSFK